MINNIKHYLFIILGVTIPISIAATNIIITFLVLCWLIEGGLRNKIKILKAKRWPIYLIGLCIVYILGLTWGQNHASALWLFQKLSLLLVLPILVTGGYNKKTLVNGMFAFLVTTFISSIIAIAINHRILQPLNSYLSIIALKETPAFVKYNYHNILLAFSSFLCLYLITENKVKNKWLPAIFILVYTISIFTEAGRAGQLCFVIFFSLYVLFYFKRKMLMSVSILVFLSSVLLISYYKSNIFHNRLNTVTNVIVNSGKSADPSVSENIRYVLFKESIKRIKKKPILGYGTGSFETIFNNEVNTGHHFEPHITPHNTYLHICFEIGVIGLIMFFGFFYFQLKELWLLGSGFHRLVLPTMYLFLMFIDSYLYIFTITVFYIYFYTIYSNYQTQ